MIRNIFKILCVGGILLWANSCNFLDMDPYFDDLRNLDSVFSQKSTLMKYVWGATEYLPAEGDIYGKGPGTPFGLCSDEVLVSRKDNNYPGTYYIVGEHSAYIDRFNVWNKYYRGIRRANTVLTRLNECKDMTTLEKREVIGLMRFLRAYYYHKLVELYGPVPLLPDQPLELDKSSDELSYARNTFDECIDYICADLDVAADYLPAARTSYDLEKPTAGAALALIARLRLQQASPLFNGEGKYFAGWTTKEGIPFLSQTPDPQRWGIAAAAAKRMIQFSENNSLYELYTVPADTATPGVGLMPQGWEEASLMYFGGRIDPYHSYKDMFDGEAMDYLNHEMIYSARGFGFDDKNVVFPISNKGQNCLNVTQKLVDAYYYSDGTDNKDGHFPKQGYTARDTFFSGYKLPGGVHNMYANREPRFYATVGFSGCFWEGTSNTQDDPSVKNNFIAAYHKNGLHGMDVAADQNANDNYLLTGYTCKKYVHPLDNYTTGDAKVKYPTFPVIRYAEVLLSYVEAMNEMEGSYTDQENSITVSRNAEEMLYYFNMIRCRAGLPGLTTLPSVEEMREIIEREWMIDFAHENQRWYYLKRRYLAHTEAYNYTQNPIQGMDIRQSGPDKKWAPDSYYRVVKVVSPYVTNRVFYPQYYFAPINYNVLNKNGKLIQNLGWN